MSKHRRIWNASVFERYMREGRGCGDGSNYTPWIHVQDFASRGVISRVKGRKSGRVHHLMSNNELAYFYILDWSENVVDGWVNYFKIADIKSLLKEVDEWMRRRIRMTLWKQWKKVKTKFERLPKLGLDKQKAWEFANTRKGYWRTANSPILKRTLQNDVLKRMGYLFFSDYYQKAIGVN